MTDRGPEKMDEGTETKDHFVVPSPPIQDSKLSFVGPIRSKHGHQTTSTPYVGAFQASGGINLKRSYDSGCDPTINWDTPISKAPHTMKYCGHQSFDMLSFIEAHPNEPHPQLNLLPCFEERLEVEESPTIQTDLGNASVWRDRHPTQKRRSLDMDKSPSPFRSKRHSLDLSSDSGCFSTQMTRSDSHFSSELPHPPFGSVLLEETSKSTFPGLVCSTKRESVHSIPSNTKQSFSEKYFTSGPQSVLTCGTGGDANSSGQLSDSFHSSLTPSVSEKVSKLQLVLTYDSGCSVTSMNTDDKSSRNVRSNSTPSFGEKPFKLQTVLPSHCGCSINTKDTTSGQSAHSVPLTSTLSFGERVSKLQPVLSGESGCSGSSAEMSNQLTYDVRSKSTLSFNERVSKLQPSDFGHSVNITDLSGSSAQSIRSESTQPFGNVFDPQSIVTCDSCFNVDSMDMRHQSDPFLAKAASHQQEFLTSVGRTSLEITHESEVGCNIPQAMKQSWTQTFEERLALRKMKLDQQIGLRIGKRYVDIIKELSRKLFTEPLAKVFGYLSEEELCSVCLVSRQWKMAVELETNARLRRRKYIQENRQRIAETPQENRSKLMNPARQQNFTNSNKPMAEIQTTEELPPARPVAPTLTKAEEFFRMNGRDSLQEASSWSFYKMAGTPMMAEWVELAEDRLHNGCLEQSPCPKSPLPSGGAASEARSLDRSESLRKCPKCDSPARANERDRRASCKKCQYEFCVFCRNKFHSESDCVAYIRNPAPTKIGSKQSKQNLRRL